MFQRLDGRQRRRQRAATHPGSLEARRREGLGWLLWTSARVIGCLERHPRSAVDRRRLACGERRRAAAAVVRRQWWCGGGRFRWQGSSRSCAVGGGLACWLPDTVPTLRGPPSWCRHAAVEACTHAAHWRHFVLRHSRHVPAVMQQQRGLVSGQRSTPATPDMSGQRQRARPRVDSGPRPHRRRTVWRTLRLQGQSSTSNWNHRLQRRCIWGTLNADIARPPTHGHRFEAASC